MKSSHEVLHGEPEDIDVLFHPLMSPDALEAATLGLDLSKYSGADGLVGQVVKAAERVSRQSRRFNRLNLALHDLERAIDEDNELINAASGSSEEGFGSLVIGALDTEREAAPHWLGDGPLTVDVREWPQASSMSRTDFLLSRPDVASRVRVYSRFVL